MIHVIASIGVKPGKRAEFIKIFKANVPNVLAENGCIEYIPAIDAESGIEAQWLDETVVTVIEKWESVETLRAHLQAPHMRENREKVKSIIAGIKIQILTPA